MVMEAAKVPGRGARFGWLFAAVWLFYLVDNVKALRVQENLWWRDVGLVAVAGFAVAYLYMVSLTRTVRHLIVRPRRYQIQAWIGIVTMLALFGLQVPGAGSHALTCLVYVAAFAMVSLPLGQAIPLAALLVAAAEVLPVLVPGWTDESYGLAVLLGSLASGGFRLAAVRQNRLLGAQQEIADLAVENER